MKNYEIFQDYDMVVAITQQTINDQLTHLLHTGVIKSRLRLVQEVDQKAQQYVYTVLGETDPIPSNCAFIDALIHPQIAIAESGEIVDFVLTFGNGAAAFWTGSGPLATLSNPPLDPTGWTYVITINLDLAKLAKDDIDTKKVVPNNVKAQLDQFDSQMFDINHLFMNFESTDLMRFDPVKSNAGGKDVQLAQLSTFMQFYLGDLVRTGNPYILGYSLTTNDQTAYAKDLNVPTLIRPVSTTYSMFADAPNPELSTLNFILATKGGHGIVSGTPSTFDTNWISPTDGCSAKMIYGHPVLLDAMILKPFYDAFANQVWAGIKDSIDVPVGNDFATARTSTDTGFAFGVSNVSSGDDQYVNQYTVDIGNGDGAVTLTFKGTIHFYKEVDKDLGVTTAKASATGDVAWSGIYTLKVDKDASGDPQLTVMHSMQTDSHNLDTYQNDAAKAFSWIGKILGGILDAFTAFQDGSFFGNEFAKLLSVDVPGIGDVSVAMGDLGDSTVGTIILPAGDVFAFKQPECDVFANLAMQLTYKSES